MMGGKSTCFIVLILIGLAGCHSSDSHVSETEEVLFQQGQQFLNENRPEEAFRVFQNLLEKRHGEGAKTNFELGQLFLNVKNDPIFAIYHLRQYLMQDPDSPKTRMVLQMIETAKKEFARTLPFDDHYNESPECLNLIEMVKQLQSEKAQLTRKLAKATNKIQELKRKLQQGAMAAQKTITANTDVVQYVEPQTAPVDRTYLVKNEDTLSKISLKMYGVATKWQIIFDANRDILTSPKNLKAGMRLRIPDLK